nr:neither inactivation nor afterpotential protein C [Onthophagus taurus]
MTKTILKDLQDDGGRFNLGECMGSGVFGKVFKATDSSNGNRSVAIKIQNLSKDNEHYVCEELKVLKDFSNHPNLPTFYGGFKHNAEIWFVMELCEGGPIIDLVNGLLERNRRMSEEQIAFALKETVKAIVYLHKNHIMHRDIRGSNILMTYEGEIKIIDFGLSRHLNSTLDKTDTCLGSPNWMAPEVVSSPSDTGEEGYGNRADVWAMGITAIELGDGKTPFTGMHPTRALFQIVRNPPPTLQTPSNWSEIYNDFVSECLVKNPEYRPFMPEILGHPFLETVPENNYHLAQELKTLRLAIFGESIPIINHSEEFLKSSMLKRSIDDPPEKMDTEDLAALDHITEESVLGELETRMNAGRFQTFIGDILLTLNPNETPDIYNEQFHKKYNCKSRSSNAPHIYAVADSAYQDALHHEIPQNIILSGESNSGKTMNYMHLMDHLLYLGQSININMQRIKNGVKLIQAFTQAATLLNENSTRCIMKTEVIYGRTTKVSGCTFNVYQLEKLRVSLTDQPNFHIFYYFFEGLKSTDRLSKYNLDPNQNYRFLRFDDRHLMKKSNEQKAKAFGDVERYLAEYEFTEDQIDTIYSMLSAIILLGDVKFRPLENETAALEDEQQVCEIANLLQVDGKKLCWALVNYCYISQGTATKKQHSCEEAENARNVLANVLYARLVDYVVNVINYKLSFGRTIFGEKYCVKILDMFGMECFKQNSFPQLIVNTFNEQMHYLYLQRVFAWEGLELNEEGVPYQPIHYYDNKPTLEEILGKGGLLTILDDTTKNDHLDKFIIDRLESSESNIKPINHKEFAVSHYAGKIVYNINRMASQNGDFLPPEVINVFRDSNNPLIKAFFTNRLSKTGNVRVNFEEKTVRKSNKFSSSSSEDEGNFSQIKKMRTISSTFKSICLELMKDLAVGGGSGGTHFVRCVRSDLDGIPKSFHPEIVKQQIRGMAIVETAKARQKGYPHRIIFPEFIRRYKYLAFDFDENVETTRDNCRLLLVRLKMEGWVIGKTKVFLRYYNEEYLARLYENHVKKIIKIQCMMRGFLVKRKIAKRIQRDKERAITKLRRKSSLDQMTQEEAAVILQKAYRGLTVRKQYGPLVCNNTGKLDENTRDFIRPFYDKWKNKTLFQVILQYRASNHHHLFNFAQQVHFFNQKCVHSLQLVNKPIHLDCIERNAQVTAWLLEMQPPVLKLPFRLDDIPYFDTTYMCDPLSTVTVSTETEETWDTPFKWRDNVSSQITNSLNNDPNKDSVAETLIKTNADKLINLPYNRDPTTPVRRLSAALLIEDVCAKRCATKNEKNTENIKIKPKNPSSNIVKSNSGPINPIAELKGFAKQNRSSSKDDDDDGPPFNFQAMLKRTSIKRESLKRALSHISLTSSRRSSTELCDFRSNLKPVSKERSFKKGKSDITTVQLAPGVILEGVSTDL